MNATEKNIIHRITGETVRQLKMPADAVRHTPEGLASISGLTDMQIEAVVAIAVGACHEIHKERING